MFLPTHWKLIAWALCSALLLATAHLSAATFYVAVSGSDTNDGTSPEKAWKTVTHAGAKACAGDTVFIKAGLYHGEVLLVKNAGTEKAPILFQGYKDKPGDPVDPKYKPGEKLNAEELPVLEGDGKGSGIDTEGKPYVHVRGIGVTRFNYGIEVQRAQGAVLENVFAVDTGEVGIFVYDSVNSTLRNCTATDAGVDNIWLLRTDKCALENCKTYGTVFEGQASTDYYIILTDCHDNTIRDCLAHNLHAEHYKEHGDQGHPGHGIGIKDRSSPKGYGQPHSERNKIVNCVARNMGEHFFVAHEALNNDFVNCTATGKFRTQAYWSYGLVMRDGAHDNTFRECRVEGARTSIGIQETVEGPNNPDGSNLDQICSKNTVANCVFVDANVGIEIGNADDNLIRNCVFDDTGEWAFIRFMYSDRNRRLDHRNKGNACRNTVVTNVRGAYRQAEKDVGDEVAFTYSDFWKNKFKMPAGEGTISVDPLFVDAEKRDYHLKSQRGRWDKASGKQVKDAVHSPCIDAGDPKDDFATEPKPDGGRIDIGAYGGISDAPPQDAVGTNAAARPGAAVKTQPSPARPKADEAAVRAWTERLRARVKTAIAEKRPPRFTTTQPVSQVTIRAIDDSGEMQVTIEPGMETGMRWVKLETADHESLAVSLTAKGAETEDHALAAFFLYLNGKPERAYEHLGKAGESGKDVASIFVK